MFTKVNPFSLIPLYGRSPIRFEEMKVLRKGRVGNARSYMLEAYKGLQALKRMLEMGETIYLSQEEKRKLRLGEKG